MFGYRLVREKDWDDLIAEKKQKDDRIEELNIRLLEQNGNARSSRTMYEAIAPRMNQLEQENASYRARLTGMPAVAVQIQRGEPVPGVTGAGMDLFEDVGDEKAREMKERGLLPTEENPIPVPPSMEALSDGWGG